MSAIDKIKAYALSNQDIQDILEPDTKILTYPEFCTMDHIDEAFDSLGRCVFLFLTKSATSGHWLCMFKRGANTIEYFDSYGDKPEDQRKWLTPEQLQALNQGEPCLLELLKASRYKVYYSPYDYQSDKNDINTCGRWVAARLLKKELTNKQFYHFVISDMKQSGLTSKDDWVALWTYQMIGK
jgi:hypothetical protein